MNLTNGLGMIPYWSILDPCVICIMLNVRGTVFFVHLKNSSLPDVTCLVCYFLLPFIDRDCELLYLLLFDTDLDQFEVFTSNFEVISARSGSWTLGQQARRIVQKWSRKGPCWTKAYLRSCTFCIDEKRGCWKVEYCKN